MKPRARPARHQHASRGGRRTGLHGLNPAVGRWMEVRRARGSRAEKRWNARRQSRRPYHAQSGAERSSLTHTNTQSARHTANNSVTSALSTQPPRWMTRTRGALTDTRTYCRHASCSVWAQGSGVFTQVSACTTDGCCHVLTDCPQL